MTAKKENRELKQYIDQLQIGDILSFKNLSLVPLTNGESCLNYILAADALRTGELIITELHESGSVGELQVSNRSDKMILIVDGEELTGAKQNRIVNTTVLVQPKSKLTIPVSCVEEGRWRYTSSNFSSEGCAPAVLRAKKCQSVSRSLVMVGTHEGDQGEVWNSVSEYLDDAGVASATGAMKDAVEKRKAGIRDFIDNLIYPDNARGILAAINGRFIALDLFDKPQTLKQFWEKLISSYAFDAIAQTNKGNKTFDSAKAKGLLSQIASAAVNVFPAVGLGDEFRFETDSVIGQALVASDVCVHLSAFPKRAEIGSGDVERSRMLPPSKRRNRGNDLPPVV